MLRFALAALGLLVVVLVGLLLFEIRGDPEEPEVPAAKGAEAPDPQATAGAVPKPMRMRGEPEREGGEEPAEEAALEPEEPWAPKERSPHEMQIFLSQDVQQEILRAAAACYHGQDGKNEKMTVRYDLRFSTGVGTLERLSVIESDTGLADLEECVLVALRSLEIKDHTAPDLFEEGEKIDITILALKKRARGMGVPLDPKER